MHNIQRISDCVGIYENPAGIQFLVLLEPNQEPTLPPKTAFAIQILGRKQNNAPESAIA